MVNDRHWCIEMFPGVKSKKCRRPGCVCIFGHMRVRALHWLHCILPLSLRHNNMSIPFHWNVHANSPSFHRLLKAISLTSVMLTCLWSIKNCTYLGRPGVPACASVSDEGNIQAIHILQQKNGKDKRFALIFILHVFYGQFECFSTLW